jgi:hypothetical protein
MGYDYLRTINVKKARKDHHCDSCAYIRDTVYKDEAPYKFTEDDLKVWEKAKANNYRIKKGDPYRKVIGVYDGQMQEFKCIPELDDICNRLDFYEWDD